MRNTIKEIVNSRISHKISGIAIHHIDSLSDAVYKQLREYMSDEAMQELMVHTENDFLVMIDELVPIVIDYENKIDQVLDMHIGKLIP